MYRILLILFVALHGWGYGIGDKVDTSVLKKLQVEANQTCVIDFFASWCGACKKELPLIEKLSQKGVHVIGVDVDEVREKGIAFQKALRLTFPIVNDPRGEIISAFDPVGMPALYILKEGKISAHIIGARDNIDQLLQKALHQER